MVDIQKLIEKILSDSKLAGNKNFTAGVYRDEPILRTAAQITRNEPPEYREMRRLAKGYDVYGQTGAKVFYQQAKFMENFEDDYSYPGEFFTYFPTYQTMNDMQLRGYFSWRTKVRRGNIEKTSLSFVFVYIYELLHQIGVGSPEEGFEKLKRFWTIYKDYDNQITHYVTLWLKDYVVYYNLDKSLLQDTADAGFDTSIDTLLHHQTHSADEIFSALNTLSSYRLENSKFYKEFPDDVKQIVCRVYATLADYYNKNRKNGICEKFFGRVYTDTYVMFRSAVFYDRVKHDNYLYEISSIHRYRCKYGSWYSERFYRYSGKNQQIGSLLKTIDFVMRQKYNFKSTIKPGKATKLSLEIIGKEVEQYREAKRKEAIPVIEIDVAKLHHIRKSALETQNRLITEEDTREAALPAQETQTEPAEQTNLSGAESRFLGCLLYTKAYDDFIRANGLLLSVLVDSVNEKLFDRFGDTIIVFNGDKPEIVEDYLTELKGIVRE